MGDTSGVSLSRPSDGKNGTIAGSSPAAYRCRPQNPRGAIMRSDCEVTLLSDDLAGATRHFLDWYAERDGCCGDCISLEPCEIGVLIVTPVVQTEVEAVGRWTRYVETNGFELGTLAKHLPSGRRVSLGFVSDRVYVNRTSILSLEVAARHKGRLKTITSPSRTR